MNPLKAGKEFASEPVWFGDNDRASGCGQRSLSDYPTRSYERSESQLCAEYHRAARPAAKNQVVGTINFQLDGKTIDQRPLVVLEEIPEGNFFGKIIDYIKLMFHHWFG